jgi:hypothetical protein
VKLSLLELTFVVVAGILVVLAVLGEHRGSVRQPPAVRASWRLTPGVLNPAVSQATIGATICRRGWTRTIRPPVTYTNALKRQGLSAYGLRGPPSGYQEDHLISLELGGHPTDPRNLWPEPYPRAAEVDRFENELNAGVCGGRLSLAEAQRRESAEKHSAG